MLSDGRKQSFVPAQDFANLMITKFSQYLFQVLK
jgi:hypothetical protein